MVIIGISGSEQEFNKCVLKKEGFHLGSSIAATFVRSNSFVLKSVSCVTFFSERLEPNIFIPHALGRAILKNMEDNSRFFCLGRKKRTRTEFTKKNTKKTNQNRIYKKKYAQSTRCKLFFHHRGCRSEASRRKRENSKIWSQRSINRN